MAVHEHGGNIYKYENCLDFSTNLNPLGPPKSVENAVVQSLKSLAQYPQVGYEPLQTAIGIYEGVPADRIICGNGAAELIYTLCHAVRPKKAVLPVPTFAEYAQALAGVGCEIERFFLKRSEEYQLTEPFLHALDVKPDIVFLCNPNNPTGRLIDPGLFLRILKKCEKLGILLVADECFLDFVQDPQMHTLKSRLSEFQNLFLLKAFTKRYSIPGIRLGYGLCSNQKLLSDMRSVVQPWNISGMAMAAGIAALQETAYVEEGRRLIFQERDKLTKELRALGLIVYPADANYLFFEGPGNLFEDCVKKGILLRNCANYDGLGEGACRIAVRKPEENRLLIQALRSILNPGTDGHRS